MRKSGADGALLLNSATRTEQPSYRLEETAMARSKFHPGQLVSVSPKPSHGFAPRGAFSFSPKGAYRIVRALPNAGGPPLYRVKSDSEAFERIVDESQIGIEE